MDEKKGKMNKKKAVFSPSKTHGKSSFLKIKQQIFNELVFDESAKNQSCQLFYNCKSVCYARFLCSFAQAMLIPTHCGIIFPFQTRKKSLFLLIKQHIFNALTFCKNHYQGSFCYSRLILSALHALYAIKICSSCIAPPSLIRKRVGMTWQNGAPSMPWVEDNDKLGERFALPGGGRFTHHLYHHVTSKGVPLLSSSCSKWTPPSVWNKTLGCSFLI